MFRTKHQKHPGSDTLLDVVCFVFWRVVVFTLRPRVRPEVVGWDRWRDAACVRCFCMNCLFYWDCLLSVPLSQQSFTGCDVKCRVRSLCVFDRQTASCLYNCRAVSHKQRLTLACTLLSLWKRVWDEKKPCCRMHQRLWWCGVACPDPLWSRGWQCW